MTDCTTIHPKTAIFLGAGASAAEGAPPQNMLFREFSSCISRERADSANWDIQDYYTSALSMGSQRSLRDGNRMDRVQVLIQLQCKTMCTRITTRNNRARMK